MTPLTIKDLLMESVDNRAIEFPPSTQMLINGDALLKAVNQLQELMQTPFMISSGYRPSTYNKAASGAINSPHLTCEAVDIHDLTGNLKFKLQSNVIYLEQFGLYMESPPNTPGWVHLQTRPTKRRIFIP